jgi:hypothetical protein
MAFVRQRYVYFFSKDIMYYKIVGGRWSGVEANDRGKDPDWAWAGGRRQASTGG